MPFTRISDILTSMKTNCMENHSNYKFTNLITCIILLCLFLSGCSNSNTQLSKSAVFFDTYITISIYEGGNDALLNNCMELCNKYENLFSATVSTSDIAKINVAAGSSVIVSPETISLLDKSIEYARLTDGLYDVTIYPVSSLWDFHSENPRIPDNSKISEAVKNVDYKTIIINHEASTVTLSNPNASIDLGSIAKGFIADSIKEYLISEGVTRAVINLGGDIAVIGQKSNGKDFTIGVSNPADDSDIIAGVLLNNKCIATSGTYERCFSVDNVKYHHILDSATGYPATTDIAGISVITDSALDADALCTCSILLGSKKAIRLINSLKDTECLIVTTDNQIICSDNMQDYLSE